jgi:hypothetical protein
MHCNTVITVLTLGSCDAIIQHAHTTVAETDLMNRSSRYLPLLTVVKQIEHSVTEGLSRANLPSLQRQVAMSIPLHRILDTYQQPRKCLCFLPLVLLVMMLVLGTATN